MATATRAKKKVLQNVTLQQAQEAGKTFAANSNRLKAIEAKMNAEIDRVKAKYEDDITTLNEAQAEPMQVLETYANENYSGWDKKSLDLLFVIIGFRTGTPKVDKKKGFTWDAIVELMKKNRALSRFIRTKDELNKDAVLAEKNEAILNQLKEDCFIEVVRDESFYVTAKAEEVAA